MLPVLPVWPAKQIDELSLDLYETRKFDDYGGLESNVVGPSSVVRTALHAWLG